MKTAIGNGPTPKESDVISLFLEMRELEDLHYDIEMGDIECIELDVIETRLNQVYATFKNMFSKKEGSVLIALPVLVYWR